MNNMNTRKQLLKSYKLNTGKQATFKNGTIKQAFLKWNLKQLKDNKTQIYFLKDKLFNPNTKRLISVKYDTRYKKDVISKTFRKKFNIEGSIAIKKNNNFLEFDIYSGGGGSGIYNNKENLENNNLLNYLVKSNNIQGHYRLILTGYDK